MAKSCYQKVFFIDNDNFDGSPDGTLIYFDILDISDPQPTNSFLCWDGDEKPDDTLKPMDNADLLIAVKKDLNDPLSKLFLLNRPLRDLYTNDKDFSNKFKPRQRWYKILDSTTAADKCSVAFCGGQTPIPPPAVPAVPVEPPTPTNDSGDCRSANVEVTKDGKTIKLKLLTRDKKLPTKNDLTTTLALSRYIVDTKYPADLKTAGSISVKFLDTPAWSVGFAIESVCDDRTVIGMLLKGAKCGAPEDSKSTQLYVKLPNLFPSAITIARQLDVKNYQSKTKNTFPGFNAFFIDCFRKGAMSMDPQGDEKSTVKPWKITPWVESFAVNTADKNYVRSQTQLFKDENTAVLHSMENDPLVIANKPRYIPGAINETTAVPALQITTVPMVFRIPFTARFAGKITWETIINDSFAANNDREYDAYEREPSLIGYIKVVVRVPCVHPKALCASETPPTCFDVWRCDIATPKIKRSVNEDGSFGPPISEILNTVDTILIPTFFHHYRPFDGLADNDMQRSIEEYQRNYWGDTEITTTVNTNSFPAGYTGHLTIPDLWELALSKATVHMKMTPKATSVGLFDELVQIGGEDFLTLKGLIEKIESSMAFCDCVDNFKLAGRWDITFKRIANAPTSMEYNKDLATFTLSSSDDFDSVNDLLKIEESNPDIDVPKSKYIYTSGGNAIENLNFFEAPQ